MQRSLVLNGHKIKPLITAQQADWQDFVNGKDTYGEYVACRLRNRVGAVTHNWYVFVSPQALSLMQNHNWCGNITDSTINIRRRENIDGKQCSFLLTNEMWGFFNGKVSSRIYRLGHPLDFRIMRLSTAPMCRLGYRIYWNLQITIPRTEITFVGAAAKPDQGYRMYNRALRDLKREYPNNPDVEHMLYNMVTPTF